MDLPELTYNAGEMQNNTHPSQILPENRKGAGNTFQLILQSQYYLDTTKGITRKLQSNIPHEHRWKNVYQIISKSNPATHKKDYIP